MFIGNGPQASNGLRCFRKSNPMIQGKKGSEKERKED